jgi:hypothetical protein
MSEIMEVQPYSPQSAWGLWCQAKGIPGRYCQNRRFSSRARALWLAVRGRLLVRSPKGSPMVFGNLGFTLILEERWGD